MGGTKATVLLRGRPLVSYPLEALSAALAEVVLLAKADWEIDMEVPDGPARSTAPPLATLGPNEFVPVLLVTVAPVMEKLSVPRPCAW